MSLKINAVTLTGTMLAAVVAVGVGGCGKKGLLDQPAPLFGERAKEDYAAKQAGASAASSQTRRTAPVAAADKPDPDSDNAPRSTRDVPAPEEVNKPITQAPIAGAPDLMGPTPSLTPPGR